MSGVVLFTPGNQDHAVGSATFLMVPSRAPHTFFSPNDEATVILTLFTTALCLRFFRELSGTDGGNPVSDGDAVVTKLLHAERSRTSRA